jgi:hypothetical protein
MAGFVCKHLVQCPLRKPSAEQLIGPAMAERHAHLSVPKPGIAYQAAQSSESHIAHETPYVLVLF